MDTTETSLNIPIEPPIIGANAVPPLPDSPKPPMKPEIVAAIVVVIVGALFLIGIQLMASQTSKAPIMIEKAAPTPTPTPTRLPSALATQSAFLKLETNVASLSGAINNYVVDDPSLSPPVLELPLGFQ